MNYQDFLKQKLKTNPSVGFTPGNMNENLFEFQKYCVKKALEVGRFALFEDCGLGKTIQQLEWCDQVAKKRKQTSIDFSTFSRIGSNNKRSK